MAKAPDQNLSRRQRQIMDILYARGRATAKQVLADMDDAPGRTAVRTMLRILEEAGHVRHETIDREYVYCPTHSRRHAGRSALRRVVGTFYNGSIGSAVAAHLNDPNTELSREDLDRLEKLIHEARRQSTRDQGD